MMFYYLYNMPYIKILEFYFLNWDFPLLCLVKFQIKYRETGRKINDSQVQASKWASVV